MSKRRTAVIAIAFTVFLSAACSSPAARPATVTPALTAASATPAARTPAATAPPGREAQTGAPPVQLGGVASPTPSPAPIGPAGVVLLQQSGGGGTQTVNLQTNSFTAPGSWDLNWSYNCGPSPRTGNLAINVYTASGRYIDNPPSLNQVGSSGSGTQQFNIGGTFTLTINSVCQWSVTAVTAARPTATPVVTQAGPAPTSTTNISAILAAVPTPASQATAAAAAAPAPGTAVAAARGGSSGGVRNIRAIPTPAPVVPAAVSNPLTGGAFTVGAAATAAAGAGTGGAPGAAVATIAAVTPIPVSTPAAAGTARVP